MGLDQRRIARQEQKEREEEEDNRKASHADSLDQTKIQLEQEKQARALAEEHASTLMRQRVIEEKKMKELEKIKDQLEVCLEEEIVRQLQARVLEEEWGRRDQLEKLQEEQRMMLEEERRKREEFEKLQLQKETQLRDAQKLVEDMEKERRKLDKQLDLVQEKTKRAYLSQEILEAKMKLQEHERNIEIDKEASRGNTLNPSASFYVRANSNTSAEGRGGRPSYMPMRSASMRETSYSRSIRRSRMRPPLHNDSTLSVANTTTSEMTSPNIAIEEVNSNGSNSEEAIAVN